MPVYDIYGTEYPDGTILAPELGGPATPPEPTSNEALPQKIIYFENNQDWRDAGSPRGGVADGTENLVHIGTKPPDSSYTKPDLRMLALPDTGGSYPDNAPTIKVGTETQTPSEILRTPEIMALKASDPARYRLLTEQGVDAYQARGNAEAITFDFDNTKLPDGQYISRADLVDAKRESPEVYKLLTTKGFAAAQDYIDKRNADVAKQGEGEVVKYSVDKLAKYTSYGPKKDLTTVDVISFLRDNPKDTQTLKDAGFKDADIKDWQRVSTSPIYLASEFEKRVAVESANIRKDPTKTQLDMINLFPLDSPERDAALSGFAAVEAMKGFTKAEQDAILKQTSIHGAANAAQMALLGAGATGAIGLKTFALLSGAVSGGETATQWGYLSTPEKVVAVGGDVVGVAVMLWGGKLLSTTVVKSAEKFGLTAFSKTEKLATTAGKAGQKLNNATTSLTNTVTDGWVTSADTVAKANAVEAAQRASMKADKEFLAKFQNLKSLTPYQLAELEKKSGIDGLEKVIQDIRKTSQEVADNQKFVQKSKFYTAPKNPGQIEANNRHLFRLADLQGSQGRLQAALEKADSTLKPRYNNSIGITKPLIDIKPIKLQSVRDIIAEMKTAKGADYERLYRRAQYVTAGPGSPSVTEFLPKTNTNKVSQAQVNKAVKQLDRMYYGQSFPSMKVSKAQRADIQRQGKFRQKIQPRAQLKQAKFNQYLPKGSQSKPYTKAEQAALVKITDAQTTALPKSMLKVSDFPGGAVPATKTILLPRPQFYPNTKTTYEEQRQISNAPSARREATQLEGVEATMVTETLRQSRVLSNLSPSQWQQAQAAAEAGLQAGQEATTSGATQSQIDIAIQQAIQQQAKNDAEQQAAQQTKAMAQVKTETSAEVKQKIAQETKAPSKPLSPKQLRGITKQVNITVRRQLKTSYPLVPPPRPPTRPGQPPPTKKRTPIRLPKGMSDAEKRKAIKRANGAISWRQGELHGKDRWDTITNIYKPGQEGYIIVLGDKPQGAHIVKGPGSAFRTAQYLYGKQPLPGTAVINQPGLFTTKLDPLTGKRIQLTFVHDSDISQKRGVFPLAGRNSAKRMR